MGQVTSKRAGVNLRAQVSSVRGVAASGVVKQTHGTMGTRETRLPVSGNQMPGKGRSNTNTRNSSTVQDQFRRGGGGVGGEAGGRVPRGDRLDPVSDGGAVIGKGTSKTQTRNSSSVVHSGCRKPGSGQRFERSS